MGKITMVIHADGVVTAFVNRIPGLLVQANSVQDAKRKLNNLWNSHTKRIN